MANSLITSSMVANEALRLIENNIVFTRGLNRQYDSEWKGDRPIGTTVNVKKRAKFTVRTGAAIAIQDYTETTVPVTIDTQKGIDVAFSSQDLAMKLEDFSEQVLAPQIAHLANDVDLDLLTRAYLATANTVGTPGTLPALMKPYAYAASKLNDEGAPKDQNRSAILSSLGEVELIDSQKGLFQSASEIDKQYKNGEMGKAAGLTFNMSQNVIMHSTGALGGTPLTNGVPADGASVVVTDAWTAAVAVRLKKGDVVQFAGVFAVNPMSKLSTTLLRDFVLTADASSDVSGNLTMNIYPAIIATGVNKNVTNVPADNSAITIFGHASSYANKVSPAQLVYHKDAFTFATVDMPLPKGMDMASRASSKKAGFSIRFVRGFDISNDRFISRLDLVYGFAALYPEWCCRVQG